MALIRLTLHDVATNALKPLYEIEEGIFQLLLRYKPPNNYTTFDVEACSALLDRLAGFTLNKFALRLHRRVLELLRSISKLGHDIPDSDERYHRFKSLRNQARTQYKVYKTQRGFHTGEELWQDLNKYKRILQRSRSSSHQLWYLATEDVLNNLPHQQISPNQLHRFNYCQYIHSAEDFKYYTNIRELVLIELREYTQRIGQARRIFQELSNVDRYIEYIFAEFVAMSDAWCYTLLRDIEMKPHFLRSDVFLYECMSLKRARVCIKRMPKAIDVAESKCEEIVSPGHLLNSLPVSIGSDSQEKCCELPADSSVGERDAECLGASAVPEADKSNNLVPPSDEEDGAEFEYLTNPKLATQSSSLQHLRDHCKAHEQKLAATALKHLSRFMAHSYRLNRDVTSPKDFPTPTFAQFINFTQVCALQSENVVSSSTSSAAFSPVLQHYDSNGNYYPSPVPTTIPETVSQGIDAVSYSSDETMFVDSRKANTQENEKQSLDSDVVVKRESEPQTAEHTSDSVVIVNECSQNEAIYISDEADTQELINKLMTPGMGAQLRIDKTGSTQSEAPTNPTSESKAIETFPDNCENSSPSTTNNSSPQRPPSLCKRKLFGDLNTNLASPTNSSSTNFSDESQPIRLPPKPLSSRTNRSSTSRAANAKLHVQVNPTAGATTIVPLVPNVVSAAQINPTMSSRSFSSVHYHHPLYLKLTPFVEASFRFTSTGQLQMAVRFANHSHCHALDEESARRLLQLNGATQWTAARSLMQRNPSFAYEAARSPRQRDRPLGQRILHLLFETRNYVRDGVVIGQDLAGDEQSQSVLFKDLLRLGVANGSLDQSICPELRMCLRQRRQDLGLG